MIYLNLGKIKIIDFDNINTIFKILVIDGDMCMQCQCSKYLVGDLCLYQLITLRKVL